MASDLDNLRALFAEAERGDNAGVDEQEAEDRRQALRDRVCTIGELVWKETEQAESLLGPLVRRGMTTVIGGYGGAGKSTMALEMVKAIVTGDEFLGWDGTGRNGTAFIIDLEQGLSVAQRRVYEAFVGRPTNGVPLRELMANVKMSDNEWEHVLYADWQEGVDLSSPGVGIDVVREYLEIARPDVVMIDPVYKLFMGSDLNEQVAISSFVREIQRLRTEYGFALILPMHPRKPGVAPQGLTMHDLYGSAVWSWWAEQIIMLRRPANSLQSILGFEKDRIGDGPPIGSRWNLDFTPGKGFRRAAEDAGDDQGSTRRRIWAWLQTPENRGRGFTRSEIQKALNIPESTAKTQLGEMKRMMEAGRYEGLSIYRDGHPLVYAYKPGGTTMPLVADEDGEDW